MVSKTVEELKKLFDKLKNANFTGTGTSKWYPPGNTTAYYKMTYSPARLVLRHKSPSASVEEVYDVGYCSVDNLNCNSINVYRGQELSYAYTTEEELDTLSRSDDGLEIFVKYLLKDPRYVLAAAEAVREITTNKPDVKIYAVKALDTTSSDSLFGIKVIAELVLKNDVLVAMREKNFIGEKEVVSQNMDITFQFV